jgi:hypothetical protein
MNQVYPRLQALAPAKPVYIAEFGCAENNTDVTPPVWTDAAFRDMLTKGNGNWENLIGFSWWNSYWDNVAPMAPTNMLVQDIDGLPPVFQRHLNDPRVQAEPITR